MMVGRFPILQKWNCLVKKGITTNEDLLTREMLSSCYKVNHSQSITELVINLRRNNNIKLPDAIVAASAQLLQLPLITADKGFARLIDIDCIILEF
jgi:predicted nucleic acid-binding protein